MTGVIEIEVANDEVNSDMMFEPIQERLRGRFLPALVRQESAGKLAMKLPHGLPGQRVRLDLDKGTGEVIEPLADQSHAKTRLALAELLTGHPDGKVQFAPASRAYSAIHVPTWLAWMVKAVRAGYAKLVKGTLPENPPADAKPRVFSSLSRPKDEPKPIGVGDIVAAIGKLSATERKELAALLGGK